MWLFKTRSNNSTVKQAKQKVWLLIKSKSNWCVIKNILDCGDFVLMY